MGLREIVRRRVVPCVRACVVPWSSFARSLERGSSERSRLHLRVLGTGLLPQRMRSGYTAVQSGGGSGEEDMGPPSTFWLALLRQDMVDWVLVAFFITIGFSTESVRAPLERKA